MSNYHTTLSLNPTNAPVMSSNNYVVPPIPPAPLDAKQRYPTNPVLKGHIISSLPIATPKRKANTHPLEASVLFHRSSLI